MPAPDEEQQNAAVSGGETDSMAASAGEGMSSATVADPGSAGAVSAVESSTAAPAVNAGEGGGEAALIAPPTGGPQYSVVRFGYANNGRAVVFALGCQTFNTITWAREFRYDGARARYMNRKLNSDLTPATGGTVWSDYDGDEPYGDFTVTGSTATNVNSYETGVWRKLGSVADYLHNDHLGTLRVTTNSSGVAGASRVFTAFGERLPGSATDRFGYVGAWGYQALSPDGGAGGPGASGFLHVGARYYDPSSGRFLQRDPIGIRGGSNVYGYASAQPVTRIDPSGLWDWEKAGIGALCGAVAGSRFSEPYGTIAGAVVGLVNGGYETGDAGRAADKLKETIDDYVNRNVPRPPQPPGPPPSRPDAVFERPWDEKYPQLPPSKKK